MLQVLLLEKISHQNLVWPPLALYKASTRRGILAINRSQLCLIRRLTSLSRIQMFKRLLMRSALLTRVTRRNFCFTMAHNVSIGFMSGLFEGHCRTSISSLIKKFFTLLETWQGALSCCRIHSLDGNHWLAWGLSCSWRVLMYCSEFMLPSTTRIRPMPCWDMHPQIITFGGCLWDCVMCAAVMGSSPTRT